MNKLLSIIRGKPALPANPADTVNRNMNTLNSVRDVCDAPNTLPSIKVLGNVVERILQTVQEVHTNREDCQRLALHAEQILVSLARGQADPDLNMDLDSTLERDLYDTRETMEEILRFVQAEHHTGRVSGWIRGKETDTLAEVLDRKLDESYRMFLVRSQRPQVIAGGRFQQGYDAAGIPNLPPPPYSAGLGPVSSGVPDGIYEIVHLATNTILEMGNDRDSTLYGQHERYIYLASRKVPRSQRHLWAVSRKPRTQGEYWIRSLYNGLSLNFAVRLSPSAKESGAAVSGWPFHGGDNQTWLINAKQSAHRTFTIRTTCGETACDTRCPAGVEGCSGLHTAPFSDFHQTQEWDLVLLHARPAVRPGQPSPDAFFLRNKRTDCYMTQMNDNRAEPNITGLTSPSLAGLWTFTFTGVSGHNKTFAMFSVVYGTMLDHYGAAFLNSWRIAPEEHYMLWEVVPYGDKSVLFKNQASGKLLCHRQPGGPVEAVEARDYDDAACHWDVFQDAQGPSPICIVYDNVLSHPSALRAFEAARHGQGQFPILQGDRNALEEALASEYELFSELSHDGYDTFVLGPEEVDAGRRGKWRRLRFLDVRQDVGHVRPEKHCF